ncbi:MAG: phosphoenolpyruvate---glycerone phosphotransferase subunit DhaL [Bacillota bacterium]|nr:phosphoenolpyruvate---glycerone phosphotransferase subunit DhaL [Bacillota bacterium]
MPLTAQELMDMIRAIGQTLEENKAFLTELDSAIGDADHGINMAKGFHAVEEKLPDLTGKDAGTILKTVGMTLVSTVGGAAGPLYGTAFMRAGMAVGSKEVLDTRDLVRALEAAIQGIKQRGKAERGDKTMIDALEPAYEAIEKEIAAGKEAGAALAAGVAAAEAGVEYTKGIIARKGRASYLGERSIGHQDPGATSSYLILKTMAEFLSGRK